MPQVISSKLITQLSDAQSHAIAKKMLSDYNLHPPFIKKALQGYLFIGDVVQLLWNSWGDYGGYYLKLHISTFKKGYWEIFYIPEELTKLRNQYLIKFEKDPSVLTRLFEEWVQSCEQLRKKMELLEASFSGSFSSTLVAYQAFVEEYLREYTLSVPLPEAFGFSPDEWINPEIISYCEKYELEYQQMSTILTSPVVHSFVTEEEMDLSLIALSDKSPKDIEAMVAAHQKKWFWIKNNYADVIILPVDFFMQRLKALKAQSPETLRAAYENMLNGPKKILLTKKKVFAGHKPSEKLQLYIQITETFAQMQDVRKGLVLQVNYYHKKFLERVEKEFTVPLNDLLLYSYREMLLCISKKEFISGVEIKKRREQIVCLQTRNEQIILSGESARYFFDQISEKILSTQELKGIAAQRGKIQGIARIVLTSADLAKVRKNDIMIASMTRPEMTHSMKIAAGFVTDEGGITCHAAIVARELKKPCVIGTKHATKVFKDGDVVEIDAYAGIVRKIK